MVGSPASLRSVFSTTLCLIVAGIGTCVQAQVLHRSAKNGQWVEFEGEIRHSEGRLQLVRARFACVGSQRIDKKQAAWIEVEWTTREQSDPLNYPFRLKLLVPTKLAKSDDPRTVKCKTFVKYPKEPDLRPARTDVSDDVVSDLRGRRCGWAPRPPRR